MSRGVSRPRSSAHRHAARWRDVGVAPARLVLVEQPGVFHLDMAMTLLAPGTVVLNDAREALRLQSAWMRDDHEAWRPRRATASSEAQHRRDLDLWEEAGRTLERTLETMGRHTERFARLEARALDDLHAAGLAVLAKGPVGLVLPAAVVLVFLTWTRRLSQLRDRRFVQSLAAFTLVALPWYVWIGVETKASFLRGFFLTHNVNRFLSPMENHRGPLFYYLIAIAIFFFPWSVLLAPTGIQFTPWSAFLGATIWSAIRDWKADRRLESGFLADRYVFLACWIAVYLIFFTAAGTKLPNYILPIYPAVALLSARCLARWCSGESEWPSWLVHAGLACVALVGVVTALGLLLAGGGLDLPTLRGRYLAGLENLAVLGIIPVAAAGSGWLFWNRGSKRAALASVSAGAALFVGGLASHGAVTLDGFKAIRPLAAALQADAVEPEIRIGCVDYYQPSLVFYCRRQVRRFVNSADALDFLEWPVPVYLFASAKWWERLPPSERASWREVARHYDLYRGQEAVLISNQRPQSP